jgi:Flp pilus assembly protein TadB
MNNALLLSYTVTAVLIAAAVLVWWWSRQAELRTRVESRMREFSNLGSSEAGRRARSVTSSRERMLWQAGLKPRPWHLPAAITALSLLAVMGWSWRGLAGAMVLPGTAVAGCYLFLLFKGHKRNALMLAQLPLYLDQVLRALGTGRSMDGAMALATGEARAPLKEVMERVQRITALGADLGETLQQSAEMYKIKELHMLALAVRINRVYGSSPRELLQSVITMVQRQEQARRELRALTGETRASAWVLGLLPLAMAIYMMVMNPGYLEGMWQDSTGHRVLLAAVGLEMLGSLILWRMVRSI